MKKLIIAALFACLAATSCSETEKSPLEEAVSQYVLTTAGNPEWKFKLKSIEVIDSTTFATEFDRRITVFNTRINQNTMLYNNYLKENKKNNATRKRDEILKDREILTRLYMARDEMGDAIDEIAYYDYKFSAAVSSGRQTVPFDDCFVAVTPDNEVLCFTRDPKDLHKSTGKVIPGYLEILGRETKGQTTDTE